MMNKPLAIANKPFRAVNINPSKERSFYTQGQRFAARILFIVWLLVSGSPESAEAGSSNQQAAVAPSDAIITSSTATQSDLQQLMSQHGVPDNNNLLAALDAAPPQEQCPWLEAAVKWFANQPIKALNPAAIRDYAALAHVQVTPENRELLKRYFHSLDKKVEERSGDESLIQALAYVLAHLDPAIFAGDPQPLLYLGKNLLEKLNPSQREFKQADYPSARASLEALFQALFLAKAVAPGHPNVREGGRYQSFRSHLQKIINRASYYPVIYQAHILTQTLHLLEDPQIDWESNGRRVFQGLLGAENLVAVGQGLGRLELKPAEFQKGIDLLQQAFVGQHIQPKAWYRELLSLEGKMVQCLQQQELAPYPESAALEQQAQSLREQRDDLPSRGQQSIQHDCKTFCFGIAMQLSTLALCGPTPAVRTDSIERLIALVQPTAWGSDTNVMAGLLDGLALVAVQSQTARATEAAMAREALEALAAEPASDSSGKRGVRRLFRRPQSQQDTASKAFSAWLAGEELASKLQRLREQTTEQAPRDEERLVTHVKGTQRRTATIESFRAQEMANIAQLSSYILLAKRSHFVERIAITEQLSAILADQGVCVLHGFGGAGKSTLAALYGHGRKDTQTVRWIGAENNFKLQEGYEQLAQELQVAYKPLAQQLDVNSKKYRQELARMVYQALEKSNQSTLLILDNAQDASLVADYLLHRPAAIQAIITTRSAEAFEGKYDQLQLGPFSQDQGEGYLEVCFKEMNRAYTAQEVSSLLEEVGQVPQKLELAASYLQSYELFTTAQYIARLQALKQASTNQQSRLTLPEVVLGLETLTKAGQQLMQYAAYLDADFIPFSLVSVLLEEDDPEQLSEVARDLSRLSLMQVVSTQQGQEIGLQVHREVQASCREYAGWSPEAALGTREKILLQLARVLNAQMPFVESAPNDSWQRARLYAPHVATVVTALKDSEAAPSAVVARLLMLVGVYSQQVGRNYRQAVSCYQRALAIYEQVYQETPNHPDIASTLGNLGIAWSDLGDARKAVTYFERTLAIFEQVYQETPNHPDIASTLNNLGIAWRDLGDVQKAVSFYERALAIDEQVYQETPNHPDIASTLNNLGIAWQNLGDTRKVVSYYQRALAIYEQVYKETPKHLDIAWTLNNLGTAWGDLGDGRKAKDLLERALAIYEQVYHETPNHPDIASTLNNLGIVWGDLGDGRKAVSYYQRALAIDEQVYQATPNRPDVARTLNNLGIAWRALGDGRQAVSYHERALAIYEQVYKETPNHPNIASTLKNLGIAWLVLGDARKGVSCFQRALVIFEQVYKATPKHPEIARILNNLGAAWKHLGDGGQAVSFYQRALAIFEQVSKETPKHPESARTLNNLGIAWQNLGDARKAVSCYERALAIDEQVYQETPNHPESAKTLNNLGNAWQILGDGGKAVSFYQRALAMREQVYQETPNHPEIARTLNNLGAAWQILGDARKAMSFYERTLTIYEQVYQATPNHPEIASTLGNLGNAWQILDDAHKAVSCYERALAIDEQVYQETPNHPEIAKILNNLGAAWSDLSDARKAVSFLERALTIREKVYHETPNHPDIASTLNNLGNAWGALNDGKKAVSFLKRALEIKKEVYHETPNHPAIAMTLNNLGIVYEQNLRDMAKALEYYQQALAMQQALHEGENHAEVALALKAVGDAYKGLRQQEQALEYYQQALAMQQALHEGENHAEVALALKAVGDAYKGLGQQEQALEYYQQARQMQQALQ